MSCRLLLDENVEREVRDRLTTLGHDIEDDTITPSEMAGIVDRMSQVYAYEQLTGLQKAGREWL